MKRPAVAVFGHSLAVAFCLAGPATPGARTAPDTLVIRDLGTFDGVDSVGNALNDRGQIVGVALFAPRQIRSFLLDSETRFDLGPWVAIDINNPGQVLLQGPLWEIDGTNSCFLRDGEALIDLGTPPGSQCFAADLNNRGQVVGTIGEGEGRAHTNRAFLWDSGTITDLGSLGGGWAIATALNDRGQIVGSSTTSQLGSEHAFLWENGRMTDLGAPGAPWSRAVAINNRGQVAVTSGSHVYLWDSGSMTDLGTLGGGEDFPQISWPLDMNERGQILIAVYDVPAAVFRFGIWEAGNMTPLPTLGSGVPGATRLNNRGQVVGTDRTDAAGLAHVVLWTPVVAPERGGP
jgi:probable HAF family extracellular repeat protein